MMGIRYDVKVTIGGGQCSSIIGVWWWYYPYSGLK